MKGRTNKFVQKSPHKNCKDFLVTKILVYLFNFQYKKTHFFLCYVWKHPEFLDS